MLLAIDVGNTNTVIGLFDAESLERFWRVKTDSRSTADEMRLLYRSLLVDEPEITARTLTGHGLKTGDFGRVDESGSVWIEGRKDDIIKRGGEKVSIIHVQQALQGLERFADVAVLAAPDDILGHVPVAFVVPLEPDGFKASRLLRELRGVLPSTSLPSRIIAVQAIPRTGSGKAIKAELQALLAEELG